MRRRNSSRDLAAARNENVPDAVFEELQKLTHAWPSLVEIDAGAAAARFIAP